MPFLLAGLVWLGQAQGEILQNPGFEQGAGDIPLAWQAYRGSLAQVRQPVRSGDLAASLTAQGTAWLYQQVPVAAGGLYLLQGYILKNDPRAEAVFLRLSWCRDGEEIGHQDSSWLTGSNPSYLRLALSQARAPGAATSVRVKVVLQPAGGEATIYLDDLSLTLVSAPEPTPPPLVASPTPTATPPPSPTPIATATPVPTLTPSPTPTPWPTPSPSPSPTPQPSPTPTSTPTATPTPKPSPSPTPSPTSVPTPTPALAPTLVPVSRQAPEAVPTLAPNPTTTPFPGPSPTPSPAPAPEPSPTLTPLPTPSSTALARPSPAALLSLPSPTALSRPQAAAGSSAPWSLVLLTVPLLGLVWWLVRFLNRRR